MGVPSVVRACLSVLVCVLLGGQPTLLKLGFLGGGIHTFSVECLVHEVVSSRSVRKKIDLVVVLGNLVGVDDRMDERTGNVIDEQVELRVGLQALELLYVACKSAVVAGDLNGVFGHEGHGVHAAGECIPVKCRRAVEHDNGWRRGARGGGGVVPVRD